MRAWWRRRRRRARANRRRDGLPRLESYENPYRNGICAADWTKR